MLPISISAPPTSSRPWATAGLAAVVLAVFVHVLMLRHAPPAPYCSDLTESPAALRASADTLQGFTCRWGAIPDLLHRGQELHTLLTATFVHTGWLHVVSNLLFLVAFAPRVEEDLGHGGLLVLFLSSSVVAVIVHVLVVPDLTVPSIGASGGVAGVLGAHLLLARGARLRVLIGPVPVRLPTWYVICLWAAVQLAYTTALLRRAEYTAGVSYEVHVVGFLVGLVNVALSLGVRPDLSRWRPPVPAPVPQPPAAPEPARVRRALRTASRRRPVSSGGPRGRSRPGCAPLRSWSGARRGRRPGRRGP